MQGDAVHKAATILGSARLDRRPVHPLPDDCRPASLPEAYDIQAALHALRGQATGDKLAGYKIGCTTPVMQQLVGVDAPAYGGVFAADVHAKAAAYRLGDFQMPGIECEIAVRLGSDLDPAAAPFDRHSAAAAIEACMAAMEVVDNRYGDFKAIGAPTLVADDFFHDSCVIGEAVTDWHGLDFERLRGRTLIDGAEVGTGLGADVMGHPFEAVAWLANALADRGRGLEAGQIILTGSVVATQWIDKAPTETVTIIEGLGLVSASFG